MGTLFGVMGIVMALTQTFLVGRFINTWGEQRMIQIGLISSAIGYLLLLVTYDMTSMIVVMSVMGVGNAALRLAVNSLVWAGFLALFWGARSLMPWAISGPIWLVVYSSCSSSVCRLCSFGAIV